MRSGLLNKVPALGLAAILASGLILGACSSAPTIVSNTDPTVDFSQYKTYTFIEDLSTNSAQYQSLETTYLKASVGREMEARGFTKSNTPQLAINFSVDTQEKIRSRSVPSTSYGVGYDPYYDVYYDGWGTTHTTRIDQYTEGKLNIDAIDVSSRKLVWQGSTQGRLTKKDLENAQAVLDAAVVEIFQKFPIAGPGS